MALPMPAARRVDALPGACRSSARGTTGTRSSCPVTLSLVVACVARADARTRMRGLLSLSFPTSGAPGGPRALWCLALCTLEPRSLRHLPLAGSAFSSQGLTVAGTLTMLLCALVNTVTAAWMIPAGALPRHRARHARASPSARSPRSWAVWFAWSLVPGYRSLSGRR